MLHFNVLKLRTPVEVVIKSLTCINVGLMPMSSQPMTRGRAMISRPVLRPNLSNRGPLIRQPTGVATDARLASTTQLANTLPLL